MRLSLLVIAAFFSISIANAQTFSTNTTPVGMEHNILFNATTHYTVSQTGTAQLNLSYLFDGRFGPSYTSVGPTTASPTVVLIEDLPAIHVQTGAWVGWSTRYWEARNFKVEGYNTYNGASEWVTMADYSTTNYTGGRKFSVKVPGSRVYTKLRFTFYSAVGTNGRLGVSELFYIHPEATTPYANLGLGAWSKDGTELSTGSRVTTDRLLVNNPETVTDWNNIWQSGFFQSHNSANAPETGWLWGLNMNHSSNSATYRYNGQLAIKNSSTNPTMYFRSTNKSGNGTWAKVLSDHGDQTIDGSLFVNGILDTKGIDITGITRTLDSGWGETDFNWNGHSLVFGTEPGRYAHNVIEIRPGGADRGELASIFKMHQAKSEGVQELRVQIDSRTSSPTFFNAGNVGIGTTDPKNKLSVNGTVWAMKVKVTLTDAADWVFEDDYNLRSLAEVENFIKTHKHLPEIPSAEEFRANDMEVAEMTNKLLQKIEELTLYTIAQEKQLEAQDTELKKVKELEKKLATQEARLAKLEALLSK